jgi:hypothetical protein
MPFTPLTSTVWASFLALHDRRSILPNRRVRTRTHGGVTGVIACLCHFRGLVFNEIAFGLAATPATSRLSGREYKFAQKGSRHSATLIVLNKGNFRGCPLPFYQR